MLKCSLLARADLMCEYRLCRMSCHDSIRNRIVMGRAGFKPRPCRVERS